MIKFSSKAQENNPLKYILENNPNLFKEILNDPNKKEIQIIYTQIDRDIRNKPHFITYKYNVNNKHYFYPASTIKLPVAIFALEKLNQINLNGVDKNTSLRIMSNFNEGTEVSEDTSALNGKPSIANYIKKILLVSDNDAFNRLYDFVDRTLINKKLKYYGFKNSKVMNRLSASDTDESTRSTNPIEFYNDEGKILYKKQFSYDRFNYPMKLDNLIQGVGYLDQNGELIAKPMDFSGKNVFQLSDQHELMKRLFFPEHFPSKKRFFLNPEDYDFLYTYMSKYPTENQNPTFNSPNYYPTYCKFLFYGGDKNAYINPNIRIFNKVGDAYGYTIDNAYIINYQNKVEFILSAVIQSNNNNIYNDDQYEYDEICLPFLKNLGQKIYEYETNRFKKYLPNFDKMLKYK
ncbi:hypothetical protein A5893_08230 [Pedobacter psychrophilus]|uniref:beta-lactamase n=1 Tax=Pedobacter psychrophilus TaxID=1826909 RepID=A0A179DG44_9SPHI|nr:serine hydrolase [Pedobacter psychrophilus]OAQ39928.1 hypothetical protein A5893_08230 [Pedobacter psychrophilus]